MTSTESKLLDILHAARYPTASSLPWHIEKYQLLERIMELFEETEEVETIDLMERIKASIERGEDVETEGTAS